MNKSIVDIHPKKLEDKKPSEKVTVSIIGYRKSGVLLSYIFAEKGFNVIVYDNDRALIQKVSKGKLDFQNREMMKRFKRYLKNQSLITTNDAGKAVQKSDVIVINVPVTIQSKKSNYSKLDKACKIVGKNLKKKSLVIITSIVGIGITKEIIKKRLENTSGYKAGEDFGLVYYPIDVLKGNFINEFEVAKIYGAFDKNSLDRMLDLLGDMSNNWEGIASNIKTLEAAVLFSNVKSRINMELSKEFAMLCEKEGIDYLEAEKMIKQHELLSTNPKRFTELIPNDELYLLLEEAETFNVKLKIVHAATQSAETSSKHLINLIKEGVKICGKTFKRSKITLLGISQIPNVKSKIDRSVEKLVKDLDKKVGEVVLFDPFLTSEEIEDTKHVIKNSIREAVEGADCVVIFTGHDRFKRLNLKQLNIAVRKPAAIIDLAGIINPKKVEKAGLIYRGFGRGVWLK